MRAGLVRFPDQGAFSWIFPGKFLEIWPGIAYRRGVWPDPSAVYDLRVSFQESGMPDWAQVLRCCAA